MTEVKSNSLQTGFTNIGYSEIATFLDTSFTTSEQAQVDLFIRSYESMLIKLCNRNFAYGDNTVYYETWDMDGRDVFYTYNYPIKEIKKIIIDGVTYYEKDDADNKYLLNKDFFNDNDSIVFENILNMRKRQAIKIYYTIDQFWGEDVILGIKQWVAELQQNKQYAGKDVKRFQFAGYSIEFKDVATTAEVKTKIPTYILDLISNYKKVLL